MSLPLHSPHSLELNIIEKTTAGNITAPAYRHATPSGPWPWMNMESAPEPDVGPVIKDPTKCSHKRDECRRCWSGYPQSLFPNWKPAQVKRSGMKDKLAGNTTCTIYKTDIYDDATFSKEGGYVVSQGDEDKFWQDMQLERLSNTRVRALFVKNMTVPVLEMLGTKYNIEPFFFASSLNWIPSRFQAAPEPGHGDHITITLTFVRPIKISAISNWLGTASQMPSRMHHEMINTQAPLYLRSNDPSQPERNLVLDLLAIHTVRTPGNSTIISFHPSHDRQIPSKPNTSAERLHGRTGLACQSVYWKHILQETEDPTFVLTTILWYALYAWDESLEALWEYITLLELSVISTNDFFFSEELYRVGAYILHYKSLLDDFEKTVEFVRDTPNPALESPRYNQRTREKSRNALREQCENLLREVSRLSDIMVTQDKRLQNVMSLVYNTINIEDSRRAQALTEATLQDSEAMKQIAYLSMFFLPATFCTGVFGMNIKEIVPGTKGTLAKYFLTAIPLTVVTACIMFILQGKWRSTSHNIGVFLRKWLSTSWPVTSISRLLLKNKGKAE